MRILVTDAHELAGLGALRSLGRAGHEVTAGYPQLLDRPAGSYSRYCAGYCTYPDPWKSQRSFREWLIAHAAQWDLILPIAEAAVLASTSCRPQLPGPTLVAAPAAAELAFTLSKRNATERAIAAGVLCPPTAFARAEIARLSAPFIVRTDNRLVGEDVYHKGKTWYVADASELADLIDELDERAESWLVQEHIVGQGLGAFLLTWCDAVLMQFTHERVHEVPFYGGVSSLRRSTDEPHVLAAAKKLLASFAYSGLAMVEFRRCASSGVAYFVEINGRLWGSVALALHAGADFPARFVACYQGSRFPAAEPSYAVGLYCRNVYPGEVDYVRSVLKASGPMRGISPPRRAAVIWDFFRWFLVPGVHYDYFWLRDPLPALCHGFRGAAGLLRSRWVRWRRRIRQGRLMKQFSQRQANGNPDLREVLFLCYGNICRSAFASAYWNQKATSLPPAQSAGFVPVANRRTPIRIARLARDLDVELSNHRSRVVDVSQLEGATAVFVMDGQNLEALLNAYPQMREKTWLLGSFCAIGAIHDPYELPDREAAESLHGIRDSIDAILGRCADTVRRSTTQVDTSHVQAKQGP